MASRKISERMNANTSATVIASHIPSFPIINGSKIIEADWKISVLINEIAAEIPPLFSAVKKDDIYILNPASVNAAAEYRNALHVKSYKSG